MPSLPTEEFAREMFFGLLARRFYLDRHCACIRVTADTDDRSARRGRNRCGSFPAAVNAERARDSIAVALDSDCGRDDDLDAAEDCQRLDNRHTLRDRRLTKIELYRPENRKQSHVAGQLEASGFRGPAENGYQPLDRRLFQRHPVARRKLVALHHADPNSRPTSRTIPCMFLLMPLNITVTNNGAMITRPPFRIRSRVLRLNALPLMDSATLSTICPPSRIGIGSRLNTATLMLISAMSASRFSIPPRAACTDTCAMAIGPPSSDTPTPRENNAPSVSKIAVPLSIVMFQA